MAAGESHGVNRHSKDEPDEENGGDNYKVDQGTLRRHNLPSGFTNGYMSSFSDKGMAFLRKKEKQCFVCELCQITDLNSIDAKRSHEEGAKHQAALRKHKQRMLAQGKNFDQAEIPGIRAIAPPKLTEKKQPVQLAEKLRETRSMMVGLNYILEIIACSSEEEPYYECLLCGQKGVANVMYSHLAGKQHKQKFLAKIDPSNSMVRELSLSECERRLEPHGSDDYTEIYTVYSDEMYPWDAGKAPWSIEQGGTGQPPTHARNNIDIMRQKITSRMAVASKEGVLENGSLSLSQILENPNNFKIHTAGDVNMAYRAAIMFVELASSNQTHDENRQALEICVSNAKMSLQTLQTIKHKDEVLEEDDYSYKGDPSMAGPSRGYNRASSSNTGRYGYNRGDHTWGSDRDRGGWNARR